MESNLLPRFSTCHWNVSAIQPVYGRARTGARLQSSIINVNLGRRSHSTSSLFIANFLLPLQIAIELM